MLTETIEGLALRPGAVVIDATVGGGGHSYELCQAVGPQGTVLGFDLDQDALARGKERLAGARCRSTFTLGNFRHTEELAIRAGITAIDGILFDLGISSYTLEQSGRGFSFDRDEPLLMTFEKEPREDALTADQVVNRWSREELIRVLSSGGENRHAVRIADAIVAARALSPITSSRMLGEIVRQAVPRWTRGRRIHPATRTFQAIRMAVNDEQEALREGLSGGWRLLKQDGKMAVIAFQSIEDRVVKLFFKEKQKVGEATIITRKPIRPTPEEVRKNPRSRSACLRIAKKIAVP